MPQIVIQPAALDMAPILAGIHAECFENACWSVEQLRESLRLATTQGWLAMEDGEAAGFLLCQKSGNEMELLTLCVLPARQCNGVGASLLRSMLAGLPPGGSAYLEVAADNVAARGLYEKCGFVSSGTRINYYSRPSGAVDAVRYCFRERKD
jgi:[ribosomal protein S18]-alanine N-acetyltransferase